MAKKAKGTNQASAPNYGFVGWREFDSNRQDLIDVFNSSKKQTASRRVQTGHGNVAEQAFREWLRSFLPPKFGVCYGSIIFPGIQSDSDKIEEFDIIIYDFFESPILWKDKSSGALAIPAEFVFAVIEIKSQFVQKSIHEGMKKLSALETQRLAFKSNFFTSLVFFELKGGNNSQTKFLKTFLSRCPRSLALSMIIYSESYPHISGILEIEAIPENFHLSPSTLLVDDIGKSINGITKDGALQISSGGAAVLQCISPNSWAASSAFISSAIQDNRQLSLAWTRNNFARFANMILSRLRHGIQSKLPGNTTNYGVHFEGFKFLGLE